MFSQASGRTWIKVGIRDCSNMKKDANPQTTAFGVTNYTKCLMGTVTPNDTETENNI
jgi:hypothetical protein